MLIMFTFNIHVYLQTCEFRHNSNAYKVLTGQLRIFYIWQPYSFFHIYITELFLVQDIFALSSLIPKLLKLHRYVYLPILSANAYKVFSDSHYYFTFSTFQLNCCLSKSCWPSLPLWSGNPSSKVTWVMFSTHIAQKPLSDEPFHN